MQDYVYLIQKINDD